MNKKILVIDDMPGNIQVIISIFEKYKPYFTIYQAPDGDIALSIVEKVMPDIIISDWDMPEMDGITFIKKLKNDNNLKNIPVIMSTGIMTTVEHLQTALNAGAVDYIRKPIDEIELVARTMSAINLADQNKKIIEKKNQELVENTLFLIRNNKFNQQVALKLQSLVEIIKGNKKAKQIATEVVTDIDTKIKTDSWQRFELAFNSVNEFFYQKLLYDFPNLTQAEVKLSAFLKLGLSSKDISAVLFISTDSVKVARSRLRKKLKLTPKINLQAFLSKY